MSEEKGSLATAASVKADAVKLLTEALFHADATKVRTQTSRFGIIELEGSMSLWQRMTVRDYTEVEELGYTMIVEGQSERLVLYTSYEGCIFGYGLIRPRSSERTCVKLTIKEAVEWCMPDEDSTVLLETYDELIVATKALTKHSRR